MNGTQLSRACWAKDFAVESEDEIRAFARCIKDTNPLHHDNEAARKAGHFGIIAPGVMMVGFVSAAIAEELPGVTLCRFTDLSFMKPLYAGALVTVDCEVASQRKRIINVSVTLRRGTEILVKGSCTLLLAEAARAEQIAA